MRTEVTAVGGKKMKFLCGLFLGIIVSSVFWILSMAVAQRKICEECVQGIFTRKVDPTEGGRE